MNNRKKILIVSYSYPPSNAPAAQRPYAFAKYLDKNKYDITVLICENQDSSLGSSKSYNNFLKNVNLIELKTIGSSSLRKVKKASMESAKGGSKTRIKSYLFQVASYFMFPDKGVLWMFFVIPYILKNKSEFNADIIFSTSPLFSNHIIARFIKRRQSRAIHIADFRDYHSLMNDNYNGFKKYLHKKLENSIIKKVDKVCFISESMTNVYSEAYKKYSSKFYTIYNGFDSEEYTNNKEIDVTKKLTFFYAGSFYKGVRSPKPLLLILEHLIETKQIEIEGFTIEIAGNFEKELIDEISKLKVFKNIIFLGILPREVILDKYINSHVLWLIIGNKITHYSGVPIKMYEYMGSKRPILNFAPLNSEPSKIIKELNLGWNIENNELNISDKSLIVLEIFKLFKEGKLTKSIEKNNLEKFLRKNQAKLLENVIEECIVK